MLVGKCGFQQNRNDRTDKHSHIEQIGRLYEQAEWEMAKILVDNRSWYRKSLRQSYLLISILMHIDMEVSKTDSGGDSERGRKTNTPADTKRRNI